jgi:hypothetical protein
MAKFIGVAPALIAAFAVSIVGAAPAPAQPGSNCQFSGGMGSNSACGQTPPDDYSDFIFYPPTRRGFGGGIYGGFYGDDAPPGVYAGPGF